MPLSYPVCFTRNAWGADNPVMAGVFSEAAPQPARLAVYIDAGVAAAHPGLEAEITAYAAGHGAVMELAEAPHILPGGEPVKNGWHCVNRIIADLARLKLCRHSFVVAIGGGALLDAVGFAAALVHRGIRLIRMPTTTLAQGDSGVGVKNGINLDGAKNMLGTFAPPYAVVNDAAFLSTLSGDLVRDGMAEAFKVAIIRDGEFFRYMASNADRISRAEAPVIEECVRRSALIHLEHIRGAGDPFEFGVSRPLDFGHWSAHRLETMSGFSLRHGQAVGIGIALDACYAWKLDMITRGEMESIHGAMRGCGIALYNDLLSARDDTGRLQVLAGLEQFREHLGGRLSITLPTAIGAAVEVHAMQSETIEESTAYLAKAYG